MGESLEGELPGTSEFEDKEWDNYYSSLIAEYVRYKIRNGSTLRPRLGIIYDRFVAFLYFLLI